jgi:phage shock protein A
MRIPLEKHGQRAFIGTMTSDGSRKSPEICRMHLLPDAAQADSLRRTHDAHERLLTWLDQNVPADQPLNMVDLHNLWYEKARHLSGLPARSVTLALKDFTQRRQGRQVVGLPLDDRLFAVKTIHSVSILTLDGRILLPFRVTGYEPAVLLEHGGATARLIFQDGAIDLVAASPTPPPDLKEAFMTATETVVTRIGRVIAGMTHAAVSAAEQANPAAIIEQSIREIDSAADEVKAELGKAMAEKHRTNARKEELRREHADLGTKLKSAIDAGRDELASAGLGRQIDIESQIAVLDRLLSDADQNIEKLEEALSAVKASRREAEERLSEFKASQNGRANGGGTNGQGGAGATDRAMGKVERAQAAAARIAGVPTTPGRTDAAEIDELNKLARDRAIAERLKKLKGEH